MSAEHHISPARRTGIAVAIVVALLGGTACVAPAWIEAMRGENAAAARAQPAIEYTRLEFARAIKRAIRGH